MHITPFWDEKFINFLGRGTAPPQTHPLAAYIRRLDSLVFVARPARPPQCSSGVDAHGVVVARRTWRWSRRSTTCVVSWASRAPACMTSRPLWVAAAPFQTKYVHLTPSYIHTHTHTHTTHTFNGPFSGTTRVSRYQKGKTNLDFTEARDSEWQWHQLGHMQVCTSLQADNRASTPPVSFLQTGCPSCHPTNSVKHSLLTIKPWLLHML